MNEQTSSSVQTGLPRGISVLLLIASLFVAIAGLRAFGGSIGPLALALMLVIIVRPIQQALLDAGRPAWVAFTAMLSAALGILVLVGGALVWSAVELVNYLASADYQDQLTDLQTSATDRLERLGVSGEDLQKAIDSIDVGSVAGRLVSTLSGLLGIVGIVSLVAMSTLFIASDSAKFVDHLNNDLQRTRPEIAQALRDFASGTRRYFRVNTAFGLLVAILDVIALALFGIPLALVWGVLALISSFIPNIGFVIGMIPPVVIGLLEGGPGLALAVAVVYFVINLVVDNIIKPRVVGEAVGLSATITFVSLVFWAWVFGAIGALLAVPLTLAAKALLIDMDANARWLAPLISLSRSDATTGDDQRVEPEPA